MVKILFYPLFILLLSNIRSYGQQIIKYDIVIDEIFADPTPAVGLPNYEWLELKNTASHPVNLRGWRISDTSGRSGPMPEYELQPDSFVIVCSSPAASALSSFGNTIAVSSFPSLNNDNDLLTLIDAGGNVIHAVNYSAAWYQNDVKKEGGWSLEMIDTKNPCGGYANWTSSKSETGGTPGKKNSVDGINQDSEGPQLIKAFISAPSTITLVFNEPLDSARSSSANNYIFDNGLVVASVDMVAPLFNKVDVLLNVPPAAGIVYTVKVNDVTDCKGNLITEKKSAKFGTVSEADSLDLVINEILYNPKPGGVDYVELYNRSQKIIDLKKIYIANRNTLNIISNVKQLSSESILLFPGEYMAVTADVAIVKSQYITLQPDAFLQIGSMPSFPDDKGYAVILNSTGNIVDEVDYTDKWQFPLLHNSDGVALERIDYNGSSVPGNFHSAAASSGYGTPGYKNSQYKPVEESKEMINITPEIFSPDNDGNDDYVTINYRFPSAGYVTNITVFDASGRLVRYLQKNSLSGISGYYRWDGLNDKFQKLPQGIYIIYTEIFNTSGRKRSFKNSVVLARRY